MSNKIKVDIELTPSEPKHAQIAAQLKSAIQLGTYREGQQLPSINQFAKSHKVARDTVEKAYNSLKRDGHIKSRPGKGYFVGSVMEQPLRILMVLNKLSSYKKEVYDAFIQRLGNRAKVDLQVFHYDFGIFRAIIESVKHDYDHLVVMPHFTNDLADLQYMDLLNTISPRKLVVLDKKVSLDKKVINVYQDFERDINDALNAEAGLFEKYSGLTLVLAGDSHHPLGIVDGIKAFCKSNNKEFVLERDISQLSPTKAMAYVMLTEGEMGILIKKARLTDLVLGRDMGVLSFNETILKELLGITVVSTDFAAMGRTAAELILSGERTSLRNPFGFFKRTSL